MEKRKLKRETKKERGRRKEEQRKSNGCTLSFYNSYFKTCRTQKVHLAITFSNIRLDYTISVFRNRTCGVRDVKGTFFKRISCKIFPETSSKWLICTDSSHIDFCETSQSRRQAPNYTYPITFPEEIRLRAEIQRGTKTIVTSLSRDIHSDREKNIIIKFNLCVIHVL